MGMFDSIRAICKCGESLEFQSKVGPCELRNYSIDAVPANIAMDIHGDLEHCSKCGVTWEIKKPPIPRVRMILVPHRPKNEDDDDEDEREFD